MVHKADRCCTTGRNNWQKYKISEFFNVVSFRKPVAKAGVMRRKMLEVHLVENLTFKKTESEVRSLTQVSCDMSDMSDVY